MYGSHFFSSGVIQEPVTVQVSPEPSKKLTKAEKEKQKEEKRKQEKLQKVINCSIKMCAKRFLKLFPMFNCSSKTHRNNSSG